MRWRAARIKAQHADALASLAFAIWPMQALRWWSPDRPGDGSPGRLAVAGPRAAPHAASSGLDRRELLQPAPWSAGRGRRTLPRAGERTDFGWEIYPQGLYDVLRRVGRYGKPVVITENGIADADDDQRPAYLVAHLRQVLRAISDGVDVQGLYALELARQLRVGRRLHPEVRPGDTRSPPAPQRPALRPDRSTQRAPLAQLARPEPPTRCTRSRSRVMELTAALRMAGGALTRAAPARVSTPAACRFARSAPGYAARGHLDAAHQPSHRAGVPCGRRH